MEVGNSIFVAEPLVVPFGVVSVTLVFVGNAEKMHIIIFLGNNKKTLQVAACVPIPRRAHQGRLRHASTTTAVVYPPCRGGGSPQAAGSGCRVATDACDP